MASKNRFQIIKSVGSPSVSGAERVETLADHTNNPTAHPDYMKKGAVPAVFSSTEHLTDKLCHAINYARRAELCQTKMDYDQSKSTSYVNSADNYMTTTGIKRHVVTTYVLAQVLSSLGIDGTKSYIETKMIVGTTSAAPSSSIDSYVVSYGLYKRVKDQVDYWLGSSGIDATYLKKVDAAATYLTISEFSGHKHDVMSILGMPDVLSYALTTDITYQTGTNYYRYNGTTHEMVHMISGTDYTPGALVTGYVFENAIDNINTVSSRVSEVEEDVVYLMTVNGYTRTCDVRYVENVDYYEYNTTTKSINKLIAGTDYTVGDVIPSLKYLWTMVRNVNPSVTTPYDDAWIVAQSGYSLTTDTSWVSGVSYYKYNLLTKKMVLVTYHSAGETPVSLGLWCKISNTTQGKFGYALTADAVRVEGVNYYRYDTDSDSMVLDTDPSTPMSTLWVKVWNYRDVETRAKAGYALTVDTVPTTGVTYYKYDSASHSMVEATPTEPAAEGCYVKVSTAATGYSDAEWRAKDGYARTADTVVVAGTQYYKYTEDPVPTMAAHTPAAGDNPYLLGLYVLVKTDIGGGGGSSYDDTQIKKELQKLGYALTTDTTAISGITYYRVSSVTGAITAYDPAPANPADVGAWVKVANYNDAELRAKAGYALTADTSAVYGVTYYQYTGGSMTPYPVAPTNPSSVGAWCKIKNASGGGGGGGGYDELRERIEALEAAVTEGVRPDWKTKTDLTLTRTSSTNTWTTDTIPADKLGLDQSGTIYISFNLVLDAATYCQVQALDSTGTVWTKVQNFMCFHTYTNPSYNNVCRINFTGRCGTGDSFRVVVKARDTDIDAKYSSSYTEFQYVPTLVEFVPDR